MKRKNYKQKIPQTTYQFVESSEGTVRVEKAYRILFEAVMNSQDWGPELNALKKDNGTKIRTDK